jgi:hypothetical protein
MTAAVKSQVARMLGETLREAGVLVGVLAPLEALVTHGRLTVAGGVATLIVALPCLGFGIFLSLEEP